MAEHSSQPAKATPGGVRRPTPIEPRNGEGPCAVRWASGEACRIDADGDHRCWRRGVHRTHLCDCGAIKVPATTAPSTCSYRWSEGRPCEEDRAHRCQLEADHGTHVCACLATDSTAVPV
jgi:hypothetical protein